ncbi:hypothetical protein BX666DRAFT_2022297 [Dichotomocladium elegans]|nr:hypothetical protein BX666DRAFT_2022297 [Dichotomocladium elegans]
MPLDSDQDFPPELLEKLRNLELELEDGDITQKGFEKKKATLLQQYEDKQGPRLSSGSTISTSQDDPHSAVAEVDLGGEPSAADVVDFLDYLPSPTHSPPEHETSGAALMEQNHHQIQQEGSSSPTSGNYHHQQQQHPPYAGSQSQQYYQYQQQYPQQQWQQQQQQQQGMYAGTGSVGYYPQPGMGSPRPNRPYDPRMAPRGAAPAPYGNGGNVRPYSTQQPPRYGPAPNGQYPSQPQPQPRPMYATGGGGPHPPQSRPPPPMGGPGSPRPVYRSGTVVQQQPMRPPPPGGAYRPTSLSQQQQQQMLVHGRTTSLSSPRPTNYGNYRQAPQPPRNIPPEAWRGYQ